MAPRKKKTRNENSTGDAASAIRDTISSGKKGRKSVACSSKVSESTTPFRIPLSNIPLNIVKNLDLYPSCSNKNKLYRSCEAIVSKRIQDYSENQLLGPFRSRVTALEWHGSRVMFIVGLKTGDLCLHTRCEHRRFHSNHVWLGGGPGLSVLSIHFPEYMDDRIITASIDGTVKVWDTGQLYPTPLQTVLSTGTIQRWFCCVNSSRTTGITVAGDTKGTLFLLDKNMKEISRHSIHKGKVNTAEVSKADGYTLVTASVDKKVKLFDLRQMKKSLCERIHNCGVSSAYFSKTNSCRLLTTDQDDRLSIFRGPYWDLEREIEHPHRQYMYLTPIKAMWHPQCDLIVVGRYPDPKKPHLPGGSSVDIFDVKGDLKCQLSPDRAGIITLTSFNSTGEFLLSSQALYTSLWKFTEPDPGLNSLCQDGFPPSNDEGPDDDDDPPPSPPKKQKPGKANRKKKV